MLNPSDILDTRERKEIAHALYYSANLAHGTVGHNLLMLLAKFASESGWYLDQNSVLKYENEGQSQEVSLK